MRLTLSVLFAGIILAVPAVLLADAVFEDEARSRTAAERTGTAFVWPSGPTGAEPATALRILTEAADATESNVLRTATADRTGETRRITHYVLLGRDSSALFDQFALAEGRWPDLAESRTGTAVVASTGGPDRLGVPHVVGGRYELEFAPLHHAFDALPTAGGYVLEAPDGPAADRFLAIVHQRLVEAGAASLEPAALERRSEGSAAVGGADARLNLLAYVLAGTAVLVDAFILMREGKRIGVLRLTGHSTPRIWYRVVGRLQLLTAAAGLAACAVTVAALPGADARFGRAVGLALAEVSAVAIAATAAVGLVVVARVHVADLVKGGLS